MIIGSEDWKLICIESLLSMTNLEFLSLINLRGKKKIDLNFVHRFPKLKSFEFTFYNSVSISNFCFINNSILQNLNHLFFGLECLKILNLSCCKIELIDLDAFSCLKRLEKLLLTHNNIKKLTADHFNNLSQFKVLDVNLNYYKFGLDSKLVDILCDCEERVYLKTHFCGSLLGEIKRPTDSTKILN